MTPKKSGEFKMPSNELTITDRDPTEGGEFVNSGSGCENVLVTGFDAREALAADWNTIVDDKLIEWGNTRSEFEVEGLVGPSREALGTAFDFVKHMRRNGWPLPTGVIPDGEGGVVFENRHDPLYQRIEIDEDGRVCLATFHNCQLMERVPVVIK